MNDTTVLLIGGGKHGANAGKYFKDQAARVILVDNNPDCPAREFVSNGDFHASDAKDAWELALRLKPDFIVPTCPGHTLGKWIGEHFHLRPLPDFLLRVLGRLPSRLVLGCDETKAVLVSSYMTSGETCSGSCIPYPARCTVTGEPRPAPLFRLLDYAIAGLFDCGKIFESEQMAAGVGAIRTSEFLAFVQEIEARKPRTLAVGTACHCHGILTLFETEQHVDMPPAVGLRAD